MIKPCIGSQKRNSGRAISWRRRVDVALGACFAEKASGKVLETPLSLHSLHLGHSHLVIEPQSAHASPYQTDFLASMGETGGNDQPQRQMQYDQDPILNISMAALLGANCSFPTVIQSQS